MAVLKTAISLDELLLLRIDELARALDIPRSRLLAMAAEEFLQRHENGRLLARLNQAYADAPEPEEIKVRQALRARRRAKITAEW